MRKMNRMLALFLAAAIMLGFYVPTTQADAAIALPHTYVWETEEDFSSGWNAATEAYWSWNEGVGKHVKFDMLSTSGETLFCVSSHKWANFEIEADVRVYSQGVLANDSKAPFANVALEFAFTGTDYIRFVIIDKVAKIYRVYKTNGGNALEELGTLTLTGVSGNESRDYTLKVSVENGVATASVSYYSYFGLKREKTVGTITLSDYPGVKEGGVRLHTYRSGAVSVADKYFVQADIMAARATVYSYTEINYETAGSGSYTDNFDDEETGKSPDYWVEDSRKDAFLVADNLSGDGNVYMYTGTEYARTWLHVFETNVQYDADIFVPKDTTSGKVGLIARMSGLNVPGHIKVGYDFEAGCWFVEDGKGDTAIFGEPVSTTYTGSPLEPGKWNTVRIKVIDRSAHVYCNNMDEPIVTFNVEQVTTGRVGLFAEGMQSAYFDNVHCALLSGQGRVEKAVLANYIVGGGEGGAIFAYNENTLIFNLQQGILYKSTDNGMTFTKIEKTDAEYATYKHLAQAPRTQYIKLHDGNILQLSYGNKNGFNGNGSDYIAYLYDSQSKTWEKGGVLYNIYKAGDVQIPSNPKDATMDPNQPHYFGYYSGGMNEMIKEINLGDIDGDGEDNYRVFHCADVRSSEQDLNLQFFNEKTGWGGSPCAHWQEVYYSDDSGKTWNKAEYDTRWLSGMKEVCESRIMPVYNDDGTLRFLRMFCTWNDGRSVRYFDSYDYGQTWQAEKALPQLSGGRNSFAYAIDQETGYIYLTYLYGESETQNSIYPRNRLVLLRSKDATNWEYLMDVWRWDDVPGDQYDHVNQTVDPSITIDGDYIYVTAGFSEVYQKGSPHNLQEQHLVVVDKTALNPYVDENGDMIFPDEDKNAHPKDICNVEVTKLPSKLGYLQGAAADFSDGEITVYYYDGTTEVVSMKDAEKVRIQRPDVDELWRTDFATTTYPITAESGKQWIRVEYIGSAKYSLGFADGFYIYVAETEDELYYTLIEGIDESEWEAPSKGQETYWKVSGDTLTAEFNSGVLTNIGRRITESYKWSGYSVSANITTYLQEANTYAQAALIISDRYQLRITNCSTSGCVVVLRDSTLSTEKWLTYKVAYSQNAVNNSLTFPVKAVYREGKLSVTVGTGTQTWDVDCPDVKLGFFVYRNGGFEGTVKASLNSLKLTAPSKRISTSAALEGNIAMSIEMAFKESITQVEGVSAQITCHNKTYNVSLADAKKTVDGNYVFTIPVAAKNMRDVITARFYTDNGTLLGVQTYTVADYLQYICDHAEEPAFKEYAPIAQALMNYGAAAQLYFSAESIENENLANGGFKEGWNSAFTQTAKNHLDMYKPMLAGKLLEGVEIYSTSVILEDQTTIRHYLRMTEDTAAKIGATVEGQKLELQYYGRYKETDLHYYYVDVENIGVSNLDYTFAVSLTDGKNTCEIRYSVLSYVYLVLQQGSNRGTELETLAQALYLYNLSCEEDAVLPEAGENEFEILPF